MTTVSAPVTVSASGLTLRYGATRALDDVSLRLGRGVTGLLGPNGAGKTTLLRVLATSVPAGSGAFTVLGHDPATARGRQEVRRVLGYLPQTPGFHPDFTPFEFVDYVAILKELTDRAARHREVRRVLDEVGLAEVRGKRIKELSGGMRQRVALAAALVGDPGFLVLDEPTVGLDPVLRGELWELFHDLADRGVTLLISSHVMDEAGRCERLLLMREGRLLADDTPAALRERTGTRDLEDAFLRIIQGQAS
jgi:ABC-2 type transport system ATP-binding protein